MYDVGTHIDLTFLNRKAASTFQETTESQLQEIGTAYKFSDTLKAFKQIPVAFQ